MKQMFRFRNIVALLVCGLWAAPALGASENEQAAQAAFDEALKLMRLKRYAEACSHLARSQELDPAMGTQFRLAECYEKLGRAASAYDQYVAVAEAAKAEKQTQREVVARGRATALESKIARLTIDISPSVANLRGVEIRRDGMIVQKNSWGRAVTIDAGDHIVTVRAPGKIPFERKLWADASAKLVVSVAALDEKETAQGPARSPIPTYVLLGTGAVGVGLGITFVALRAGRVTEAQDASKQIIAAGGNCRADGPAEFRTKCATLLDVARRGDTYGTISIVSFSVGGAALLGMGAYLLWPQGKPRDEGNLRILPILDPTKAGFVASGVF